MADKRIIELEERLTLSDGDYLATDNTNGTCKVNAKILLDRLSDNEDAIATKAAKVDLTNISITGSTNNTGSTIASGSFFYKDGTLVRAKTDIANNATLTLNTNYEIVTAGGLNALNNALSNVTYKVERRTFTNTTYTALLNSLALFLDELSELWNVTIVMGVNDNVIYYRYAQGYDGYKNFIGVTTGGEQELSIKKSSSKAYQRNKNSYGTQNDISSNSISGAVTIRYIG